MSPDLASMRQEYDKAGLSEEDLAPTWLTQFEAWFEAASVLREPNAMVFATVGPEAQPHNRTVLLKGVDERGFVLYTNYGSRKGRESQANPLASLLFPWHELERQVIVDGTVERVDEEDSDAYFAQRPRKSQVGAWASLQSAVVTKEALQQQFDEIDARFPDEVPRPPFWGGLRVVPHQVEFWQGRRSRMHDRLRYRLSEGDWLVERLSP